MSAPVVSLPPNTSIETTDFLRRLAAMMRGGQNAEMLLQAASQIETLSRRQADDDRARLIDEMQRLCALAEDAQARLAKADAEIGELRAALQAHSTAVVAVPIHTLRLARAQFNHLAHGFAKSGDLISQTICEIGGCAIDQALAGEETDVISRNDDGAVSN